MLFRTAAQKSDLKWSWQRGDRAFFAAGACHILADAFIRKHPNEDFRPWMFLPAEGFRGGHIFATNGKVVFDYHGFSGHDPFVAHYFRKIRQFFPGWQGSLFELHDFMTPTFFKDFNHRAPEQYFQNPIPRAEAFVERCSQRKLSDVKDRSSS